MQPGSGFCMGTPFAMQLSPNTWRRLALLGMNPWPRTAPFHQPGGLIQFLGLSNSRSKFKHWKLATSTIHLTCIKEAISKAFSAASCCFIRKASSCSARRLWKRNFLELPTLPSHVVGATRFFSFGALEVVGHKRSQKQEKLLVVPGEWCFFWRPLRCHHGAPLL